MDVASNDDEQCAKHFIPASSLTYGSLAGQHLRARREGISEAKYRVLVKRGAPRRSVAQRLRSPLDARGRRGRDRRGRERGKDAIFFIAPGESGFCPRPRPSEGEVVRLTRLRPLASS